MRHTTLSVLALVGLCALGLTMPLIAAQQQASTLTAGTPAGEKLLHVEHFALGGVGFAGRTSDGEKEFRTLLAREDAVLQLSRMVKTAGPAGRLYALLGLRWLKAPDYLKMEQALRKQKSVTVSTMSGCIMQDDTVAAVAERIAKGEYDNAKNPPVRRR